VRLKLDRDRVISLLYRMRNGFKRGVSRNVSAQKEMAAVEEIFAPLGLSWKSFVETRLSLLNKPPHLLDAVRQGKITYTKAMAIAKIPNEGERKKLLQEAIAQNLSLKTIRKRIQELPNSGDRSASPQARIETTYQHLKAARIWENPAKWERLQHLLTQLEELLTSD
jgi:ParB family chromosome partitioning protein